VTGASDTVALTETLIRRKSVTPDDAGCQNILRQRLEAAGFRCEDMPFADVSNLWARHGSEGPVLVFAGHTDVVPAGPEDDWDTDPYTPSIVGEMLAGRGTADMKAALAAMTDAAATFTSRYPHHPGSIAFLITSDEEGRARDGTLKVLESLKQRGEHFDWCVIGEPSSTTVLGDAIKVGRRGSLTGHLTINGLQGHVAYPQLAENPIHTFAPVLDQLCRAELDEGNQYFPPTSFQVVELQAGAGAPNVIPGELYVRFNFRYSTEWTHVTLKAHIEQLLDAADIDYSLRWHLSGEPFLTDGGPLVDGVVEAIEEVTGQPPELSTSGGTSDGRFISPAGAQVVEFGAVNRTIHKVNECIPLADIDRMRTVYYRILEKMLLP
jgi:succinyl-diaminopimelate desuccinylase